MDTFWAVLHLPWSTSSFMMQISPLFISPGLMPRYKHWQPCELATRSAAQYQLSRLYYAGWILHMNGRLIRIQPQGNLCIPKEQTWSKTPALPTPKNHCPTTLQFPRIRQWASGLTYHRLLGTCPIWKLCKCQRLEVRLALLKTYLISHSLTWVGTSTFPLWISRHSFQFIHQMMPQWFDLFNLNVRVRKDFLFVK